MGFIGTAATTNIIAKLTPIGRQLLVSTNNKLITKFSLGDSDRNYNVTSSLATGEVPNDGGNIGPNSTVTNSVGSNIRLKSLLLYNSTGALQKPVEIQSTTISSEIVSNGVTIASGTTLTHDLVDRYNYATDSLVNLFYSFGLPITAAQILNYTGKTSSQGGFSNTGLSGLSDNNILVIGIDGAEYGEMLDGKTIKLALTTTGGTYNIYSTFQNTGIPTKIQDSNYVDSSTTTSSLGNNLAFLFSDTIKKPNGGDATLSWSTGYNSVKPFSLNKKQLFNLTTDSNIAQSADTCVGVAYLDKGFLVITHPTIVDSFNLTASTATTVTFNSISTSVYQNITCIAGRGEFGSSTNPTFSKGDIPSISELGLYDDSGNLIAIAKTDRQIPKTVQQFMALGVKIVL